MEVEDAGTAWATACGPRAPRRKKTREEQKRRAKAEPLLGEDVCKEYTHWMEAIEGFSEGGEETPVRVEL